MRRRQLESTTALAESLVRSYKVDGPAIKRSVPQLAKGPLGRELGWQTAGLTKRGLHNRFRNQITRRLDYLIEAGVVVESWEPVYAANGEGEGILVHLRADVAQLAKAPTRRPRRHGCSHGDSGGPPARTRRRPSSRPARRLFSEGLVSPPLREWEEERVQTPTPSVSAGGRAARARGIDTAREVGGLPPGRARVERRGPGARKAEGPAIAEARRRLVDAFELRFARPALYSADAWDDRLAAVVAELADVIAYWPPPASGYTQPASVAWFVRRAEVWRRRRTAGDRRARAIARWRRRAARDGYLPEFEAELERAGDAAELGSWFCVRRAAARARAAAEHELYDRVRPFAELGDRTRDRLINGFDPRWRMAPGRRRFVYRPGLA
jgi:hypothetical protein